MTDKTQKIRLFMSTKTLNELVFIHLKRRPFRENISKNFIT